MEKVELEEKGKRKHVMKIRKTDMPKDEFINKLETQTNEFKEHVERVKRQYDESRNLKANLNSSSAILQMDFAENYQCKSMDETHSAYWNKTSVTLHPIVVYFQSGSTLKHKSFVVVSDTSLHSASTVLLFLDEILPEVKAPVPDLELCHYWTDSPTSQYRNKLIFDTVANHDSMFNCRAVWNYFEE